MNRRSKNFVALCSIAALTIAAAPAASAMHIMEGFLQPTYCIMWGALCIPFIVLGFMKINKTLASDRKLIVMLSMAGAFAFILSALKIPSFTGSCSHMTGTGLCAILFGPCATAIIGAIVLLFQALLLAHGGVTTLGANIFSMAIAGPIVSWLIYKALKATKIPRYITVFLAAALGDLFTYCVTAFELAIAHPAADGGFAASLTEFMGIFAVTQIPLAVVEGFITVVVVMGLESFAASDLISLGFLKKGMKKEALHE
ncbi:MAG: energy-coupling factor ABC transporter permease [Lachnospiraceae bacterium]|nr:energy-coupling factor ABC transporter permease [Lachnospiraceae bacterium]